MNHVLVRTLAALATLISSPALAQPGRTTCVVERSYADAMGSANWPRWYDRNGALLGGEWSITYTGRGTERIHYDAHGRVRLVTARHRDTAQACYDTDYRRETTYDEEGRLIRVDSYVSTDHPPETQTTYGYDALGRLVSIQRRGADAVDLTLVYENGRLARSIGINHDSYGYTVDMRATFAWQGDRLVRHVDEWSAEGRTEVLESRFGYDEEGRMIRYDPPSIFGHARELEYDGAGRILHTRENGFELTFTYDAGGRVERVARNDGPSEGHRYSPSCSFTPVADLPEVDALALLRLVPCIPTETAGCISPNGRGRIMRR